MPLTAWTRALGTRQGRVVSPAGWTPPDGTAVFVLGHDTPGQTATLNAGDYVEVTQTGDFGAGRVLRFRARTRPPATPPGGGLAWRASLRVDGVERWAHVLPASRQRDWADIGFTVADVGAGDHAVAFRLTLTGSGGPHHVELPAFYVDLLTLDPTTAHPILLARDPEPAETGVPVDTTIAVTISDPDPAGGGISVAGTFVYVGGVLAFNGAGGFTAGFDGPASAQAATTHTLRITIDPTTNFAGQTAIPVRVVSVTSVGAHAIDTTYSFTTEDITAPAMLTAVATGQHTIRVTWDAAVVQGDGTGLDDSTRAANYTIDREAGACAVALEVVGAAAVSSTIVDLTTDIPMTPGALYTLTAANVEDLAGNAVAGVNDTVQFYGFAVPVPAGRAWDLYGMVPEKNRAEDATGDLRKFLCVVQEVTDLLLYDIDAWVEIIDLDTAREPFVDAMLIDLGNPFAFELSLEDKRRLAGLLVSIYKQKGTDPGIINAIRFFLGIDGVTVVAPGFGTAVLGIAELGVDFELGSGSTYDLYSFEVHVPITPTAEQVERIITLVQYMRPAWTHFVRLVTPTTPIVIDHLELGSSELGSDGTDGTFILH